MNRPVILVDLDNVVYPWTETMAWWLCLNGATSMTQQEMLANYDRWEVWEAWDIPKGEFVRWWRLGIEQDIVYRTGNPIVGARNALWQLSDAEWHIHIATSRLTKFGLHDKIMENTAVWLRDNNIPYRDISLISDKTRILADAIVDDKASNMSKRAHNRLFEFDAPHNDSNLGWDDVVEALLEREPIVV